MIYMLVTSAEAIGFANLGPSIADLVRNQSQTACELRDKVRRMDQLCGKTECFVQYLLALQERLLTQLASARH